MTATASGIPHRDCPYFGLDYYDQQYSAWFFGREAETNRIISNLRSARLTLLHADSGVGKSSLLRAGVASRLATVARADAARGRRIGYVPVVFKDWKDDPLPALIACIRAAVAPFQTDGRRLDLPDDSLGEAIRGASGAVGATLLLMLDQFEEYFLYCEKEPTPRRLADELAACINDPDLRANFLIAIREDAYAGLGDMFKGKIPNVFGNYLDVAYLTHAAAADAIRKPVLEVYNHQPEVVPVEVEPALVTAVLDQVRAQPAEGGAGATANGDGRVATPLLQLVMETLWKEEEKTWKQRPDVGRALRLETLERLEGVERIVDTHLAKALDRLGPERRSVAIDAFDHLVTPSGGKIAESIPDLAQRTGHSEEAMAEVLKRLDHERILRPVPPPPGRDQRFRRYEIFHDVLGPAINRVIAAGQKQRLEAERLAAEEETRSERERARKFRMVAAAAVALLAVAVVIGGAAFFLWRTAVADRNAAESRRLAASAEANVTQNPELATLLALRALRVSNTGEAKTALRDALPRLQVEATLKPAPPVRSAAFSHDGSKILTAGADGGIRIWDAGSHAQLAALGNLPGLNAAALSPDNSRVVAVYDDGAARVWSVSRGTVERVLVSPASAALASVAFSPNGKLIATGGSDGMARLWNANSGALLASVSAGQTTVVTSVVFSRDGKTLLGADGHGQAFLWDLLSHLRKFQGPAALLSAAFSPDDSKVIAAAADGTATVWDARTGKPVQTLPAGPSAGYLWAVAFSPDGRRVTTGGGDGIITVWPVGYARVLRKLTLRPQATVTGLSYSRDGNQILAAGADGTATVWDATTGKPSTLRPTGGTNALRAAEFSPDGKFAVLASRFGTLSVYSCGTHCDRQRPTWTPVDTIATPESDWVNSLAIGPSNGRMLVVGASEAGRVWRWDITNGATVGVYSVGPGALNAIAIDPAKPDWVVAGGDDGISRVYDMATGTNIADLKPKSDLHSIRAVAFSPDGKHIETGDNNGQATQWSTATHKTTGQLSVGVGLAINSIAFGDKGRKLVFGEDNGYTDIYPARSRTVQTALTEPGLGFTNTKAASLSPDGTLVLTASDNSLAHIWDLSSQKELLTLSGHDGPITTAAFNFQGTRVLTASADGTAKIWDAAPIEQQEVLPGRVALATVAVDPARPDIVATSANVTGNGTSTIWSRRDHRPIASLANRSGSGTSSAEFSPDGTLLVTSAGSQQAKVWSMRVPSKPELLATLNLDAGGSVCRDSLVHGTSASGINSATFSRDDTLIATADNDGSACIWRRQGTSYVATRLIPEPAGASGGLSTNGSSAPVRWAVFSPRSGSLLLTASNDGTARIWKWASGTTLRVFSEPSGDPINTAWFSPTGDQVVTASNDGTAGIWSASTGIELRQLVVPDHSLVSNANFSPNGKLVATCGGVAHIFDATTGQRLTDFSYGSDLSDCEFSPDGRFLAAAGGSGPTRIFKTELDTNIIGQLEAIARQRVTRPLTVGEKHRYGIS